MNRPKDLIDVLTDAFLEAVQFDHSKYEYNRILFCTIEDIKQFKLCDYKFEKNAVFEATCEGAATKGLSIQMPVIYVSFCGTILKSGISEGYHWHEIMDCGSKILCKSKLVCHENVQKIKDTYYKSHRAYREMEKECLTNDTPENQSAVKRLCVLWQLDRRSKEISAKLTETRMCEQVEFRNRRVRVVGKICQNRNQRYVMMQQCVFISDEEYKKFQQCINLGK